MAVEDAAASLGAGRRVTAGTALRALEAGASGEVWRAVGGERRALGGEGWRGVAACQGCPSGMGRGVWLSMRLDAAAASRAAVLAKVVVPQTSQISRRIFTRKFIDPPSHGRECRRAAPTGHQMAPDAVSWQDGTFGPCHETQFHAW